jgi:hypothetical protein
VVRLKTDLDFWTAMNSPEIGGFGVPWGPWGFNSGMDVEDVDREEAEQLGLLAPGARVAPVDKDFNERLQASATGLDDDMLAQLRAQFGEQIEIAGGAVKWKAYAPTTEPPKPKPITKPRPQPEPQPEPTTLDEVLEKVGIANKEVVTADDMIRLRDELKESKPVDAATVIASVQRPDKFGALTEANIRKTVQEFIDFLPPALVRQLPRLELEVKAMGANGDYTQGGRVRLGPHLTTTPSEAKRVIFHELMHWVHREGPESYRQIITQHFNARTAGESIKQLHPYGSDTRGKRDRWYEPYAGRVYGFERPGEAGLEVPTRYIEWLARPPQWMAEHWNDPDFRETMLVVLRGLF